MNERGAIIIPYAAIKTFSAETRAELSEFILAAMGITAGEGLADDEEGLAKLSVADAKHFLNNCSEKSVAILHEIVSRDGRFLMTDITRLLDTTPDQLRGAWAGLTKRVRTITKNPEAVLLNWYKSGDNDWRVVMASQTVNSMRTALSERK
ncbi:MAG: hypothetical protein BGO58_12850 [Sphingopyxis sp. 65-8]|nr:hypothetical protein [Sphingopyxis terrae]MEA3265194.1 hypothetical protein [Pseudomonadota bacterium]OJW23881.1 MAG: hypothetical protein BGO58_12850 [Sphingopyxis sp. 65-8]